MGDKNQAQEAKAKGNAAFVAKDYAEAIKHFTEAITHDPSDHVFYSNRSACYASLEKYEEALKDGAECVKLKPDWPKGYTRKGLAEFFLERYDDAAETYKAGLKLSPEDPALKEGLKKAMDAKYEVPGSGAGGRAGPGGLFGKLDPSKLAAAAARNPKIKQYMEDKELMQKVHMFLAMANSSIGAQPGGVQDNLLGQMFRDDMRVLEVLAAAQGMEMRTASPEEVAREREQGAAPPAGAGAAAEEEADPVAQAQVQRKRKAEDFKAEGNQLYKKRKFEEAISMYDKAIEEEPHDLTYYNNRCAVWMEQGPEHYPKVLETCQDLLNRRYEINTQNPGGASFEKVAKVYNRMASVYEKQNEYEKAIEMYNKALTEDNNSQTRNALREIERKKEKWEKERYQDSGKAEEHREKGNEFFKNNDFAKAKTEYDEAIRRNPGDAKLYSNRAAALTKLLAYPDALRDLDECLKLDPTFVKAYSRKGAAHFFMKEYHKAMEVYDKGLSIDANNEECKRGKEQVMAKIMETSRSDKVDEEQVRHAMADPEIQTILHDPQIKMFLRELQENPREAQKALLSDAKLERAFSKLMAAGIIRTK